MGTLLLQMHILATAASPQGRPWAAARAQPPGFGHMQGQGKHAWWKKGHGNHMASRSPSTVSVGKPQWKQGHGKATAIQSPSFRKPRGKQGTGLQRGGAVHGVGGSASLPIQAGIMIASPVKNCEIYLQNSFSIAYEIAEVGYAAPCSGWVTHLRTNKFPSNRVPRDSPSQTIRS